MSHPLPGADKPPSDGSLLRRFINGHDDAATEIYRRYAPRLNTLARRQAFGLTRRVDAEDIVQSVFCAFFQAARKGYYDIPDEEDLWQLLLVIALNKLRAKRTFHQAAKRDVRLTAPADCLETRGKPGESEQFLRVAFADALALLDQEQKQLVELLLEGHEVAEIAAKVGRSKRTVERNLQAIRHKLGLVYQEDTCHGL
jgi:RNA polymerase sigma-70 factor (ECF subfamily)